MVAAPRVFEDEYRGDARVQVTLERQGECTVFARWLEHVRRVSELAHCSGELRQLQTAHCRQRTVLEVVPRRGPGHRVWRGCSTTIGANDPRHRRPKRGRCARADGLLLLLKRQPTRLEFKAQDVNRVSALRWDVRARRLVLVGPQDRPTDRRTRDRAHRHEPDVRVVEIALDLVPLLGIA